jgi:hypothetical protein
VFLKPFQQQFSYTNRFFEILPTAGFQKTDFGVSSAAGDGNTKIGFIMRIAALSGFSLLIHRSVISPL